MLTMTDAAGGFLAGLLEHTNVPDQTRVRFVLDGEKVTPTLDHERPGDTVFAHAGSTVLVLDASVAEELADRTLDVRDMQEGPRLVLL